MSDRYQPPYTITPLILNLIAEICECIGHYFIKSEDAVKPRLRRANRIRTIHASLAIENNALTLEQVTSVIDGKRVLGLPREIQEIRNAYAAYECLERWRPAILNDLLEAHKILMLGLADFPGAFRTGGVGVFRGKETAFMAPPANRVHLLIHDLLNWLQNTQEHALITGCVFHYEFEFIHPFSDGNGRLGRLWQTLILNKWKKIFAYIPVESIVQNRQEEYYHFLGECDHQGESTSFIEFMLKALLESIREISGSDPVSVQVSDQVIRLLTLLNNGSASASILMNKLGLSHRPTFRKNYIQPALNNGLAERTQPDSPRSPTQQYRITEKGKKCLL